MRATKAFVILAALLVGLPVLADDDHKGFFLELGGSLLTPGNVNTPIAVSLPEDFALCCSGSAPTQLVGERTNLLSTRSGWALPVGGS